MHFLLLPLPRLSCHHFQPGHSVPRGSLHHQQRLPASTLPSLTSSLLHKAPPSLHTLYRVTSPPAVSIGFARTSLQFSQPVNILTLGVHAGSPPRISCLLSLWLNDSHLSAFSLIDISRVSTLFMCFIKSTKIIFCIFLHYFSPLPDYNLHKRKDHFACYSPEASVMPGT